MKRRLLLLAIERFLSVRRFKRFERFRLADDGRNDRTDRYEDDSRNSTCLFDDSKDSSGLATFDRVSTLKAWLLVRRICACRSISTERNDVRSARSLGALSYRRFDATIRVKFSFARYDIGRSSTLPRSILAFTLVNASSGSVVPFFIGYVARSRLLTIPCRPAALISLISRDTGLSQREGADRIYYSPRVPT